MCAKLDNPKTVPKTYWSIINKFLSNKKTPIIPTALVNSDLVSDFEQKGNLFKNYFASQCTPIKNGSKLPKFSYKTEKILTSFDIKDDDILSIIKNLNADKAHGWDQLSMRMIKTLVDENYFSIEVFERLVFNMLFNFFLQNKLFTPCQSGFIPGDSCVLQLLSITHEIYKSFDCHPPTDMSGTLIKFDKVWHEGLIFRLKTYGVEGKLLKLLENYLTDRQQRVVLNGRMFHGKMFMQVF